ARDSPTRGRVAVKVWPIEVKRRDLSLKVEKFRELLSTNHPGFRQFGRDIYDLLIKPAERYLNGKNTVCVIPDWPLSNLSFQAIQTDRDQYMLELYAIYYSPSLQVLREMKKRSENLQASPVGMQGQKVTKINETLYAVGNPAFGGETMQSSLTLRNGSFV